MKFLTLFFLLFVAVISAQAQLTLTVTRSDDRNSTCISGVDCSLREAVNAANTAPTNDTINFAIPTASCPGGVCTITLTLGELAINSAATAGTLTITNSTGASNLLVSGNNNSRVFYLNPGANLTINGVTITKGNGTGTNQSFNGSGGGILNFGTLTLTDSIVSNNTAASNGGGIDTEDSPVTLTNSTVSGNTAGDGGGGIYSGFNTFYIGTTVTLTNSTVSGNTAGVGGGFYINGGTLNLTSVTVTRNSSTATNCTNCVGGVAGGDSNTLKNTIVAGNTVANALSSPDFFSGVGTTTGSFNLIGDGKGTTGITNGTNGNQVGTAAHPIDPKLDPALALNGGMTPNHALLPGSPAIDKGNSFGLSTDQRGFARRVDDPSIPNAPGGDGADIGAFEVQTVTAAAVSVGGRVLTASGRGVRGVVITMTDSQGNQRRATTTSFGYYHFADVAPGETYIITATGKRFTFNQQSQVLNINENTEGVNFVANPSYTVGINR